MGGLGVLGWLHGQAVLGHRCWSLCRGVCLEGVVVSGAGLVHYDCDWGLRVGPERGDIDLPRTVQHITDCLVPLMIVLLRHLGITLAYTLRSTLPMVGFNFGKREEKP